MPEPLRLLVVMDDPAEVDPHTDTTLALIAGACRRHHAVDVCTALRETNEKLSVLDFADLAPETRVTRSLAELGDFLERASA